MACATACSDCAVELASRAGGAQCSAKSAFIVHAAPAVCHRLLPECGEVMGGEGRGRACARGGAAAGVVARIGGSGYPWRARRADSIPPPSRRARRTGSIPPLARARRRASVNPQFAAFRNVAAKPPLAEKITRGFRGGKPCRKCPSKRRPLYVSTGGFLPSEGLWKTMCIHHQWFFMGNKTQHIVLKWRIVSTSRNAVARDQGRRISRNFRTRRPGGLSLLRARFLKL